MSAAYHERFAAALTAALPDGFEVGADRSLTWAQHGGAALTGFTPTPADKRQPVQEADVREWIERQSARVRRSLHHYTDKAKADARAMLDALDTERSLEIFFNAEANR